MIKKEYFLLLLCYSTSHIQASSLGRATKSLYKETVKEIKHYFGYTEPEAQIPAAVTVSKREAIQRLILQSYEKAGEVLQNHKKEAIGLGILISLPVVIKSLKSTLKQRRQRAAKARSLQELSYMLQEINALYLAEQAKHQGQNAVAQESMTQEPSIASAQ